MYKIPGRSIVCNTIGEWTREMIWCYIIMKLFRADIDSIVDWSDNGPKGEVKK